MAKLTIQTGDGTVVPGQERAKQQQAEQKAQAEKQATSLFAGADKKEDAGPDYTYKKIRFHKNDEVNPYAAQQDERYAMDPRIKKLIILAVVMAVVFFLACVLPTRVFDVTRYDHTIGTLAEETAASVQGFIGFFLDPNTMYGTYMLTVLVTLLSGAAMGLSGGVYQGALKNALASPTTLGVTSGGVLGSIIFALVVYPNTLATTYNGSASDLIQTMQNMSLPQLMLEQYGSFLCSLLGCLLVVAMVMSIALLSGRGKVNNVSLVVAGQVFASVITVVLTFVRNWYSVHGDVQIATYLDQAQTTTFAGAYTLTSVAVFAIPLLICMAIVFLNSTKLSLLAFNDEEARSMGLSTTATRNLMVGTCTVLTALVISYAGPVGFVGFLVPHMARKLIGPDFRYLLPACALMGAIMVTAVFYVTNLGIPFIISGSTGVFTSLIGCIAFLVIALRGRRSSGGEWL
ncbi:MAG: iron ABC transporter permease [Coriobacteriia bacterium]|nr:iron ABC transporter permease [Coriobacteriia bacterium]